MSETGKERKVAYDVDEEVDGVTCRHGVTYKDAEGNKTKYDVVSVHDFSELSHRGLLKLAAMQAKIKHKEDMGRRAHNGELTFEYNWVDADVDGRSREVDPSKAARNAFAKMGAEERAALIAELTTS